MGKIRMYTQKGCPHCDAAKLFFESRKVPVEVIEIGFDRVLQEGMRALSNDGKGLPVPVTISFATEEIVIGNDPSVLDRIATSSGYPAIAPDSAA
jgi:glutaredoxin